MSHATDKSSSSSALALTALGVVFGDIGTSPLYAVREAFHGPHAAAINHANILGVLSLMAWALLLIVSIKYLLFVLRADNKGEGGVLALTSLVVPVHKSHTVKFGPVFLGIGLFGSALLFGDGVITPAISVLSAVEGLNVATPFFQPFILPLTILILGVIFFWQKFGTARIGAIFGPVMLVWFATIGALGIHGIIQNPSALMALNPLYAVEYFINNGWPGFLILGAVILVITGGESLYADMGHFGKAPIQKAWFFVALPGLLLNYFGQGALLLSKPEAASNPFFLLAPEWALYPLVALATVAAIIASQALISGVFSLARQAVQLGYVPRMQIIHTSSQAIGQIYIPVINWLLFILTSWVVIEFRTSAALASAYGIAVACTMVITTFLTGVVAAQKWKWGVLMAWTLFPIFFIIDATFVVANLFRVIDGGWVPLVMAGAVFVLMTTWFQGRKILRQRLREKTVALSEFLKVADAQNLARVPGVAIFMTGDVYGAPLALVHNVKHNKCLHEKNALLTIVTVEEARVDADKRVQLEKVNERFSRIVGRYGFMETPDINDILRACADKGLEISMASATFYLGRETLIPSKYPGMALWREHLFSVMSRNSERATTYFSIPPEQVVEVGIQVEI